MSGKLQLGREAIVALLREKLPPLLQDTPILLAYLYGSVARDEATPLSDVDIALVVEEGALAPYDALQLELQLSLDLMRATGIPDPEVRIINDLPLLLRGEVAVQGIELYCRDEEARVEFETRTRDEYFDFKPFAERRAAEYLADVRARGLYAEPEQNRKSHS